MHLYKRFLSLCLATFAAFFIFLISVSQVQFDGESVKKRSASHPNNPPWGVNFNVRSTHKAHDEMNKSASQPEPLSRKQAQDSVSDENLRLKVTIRQQQEQIDKLELKIKQQSLMLVSSKQGHPETYNNSHNLMKTQGPYHGTGKHSYINSTLPPYHTPKRTEVIRASPPYNISLQHPFHNFPSSKTVETEDRIVNQLYKFKPNVNNMKTILTVQGPHDAQTRLKSENCAVTDCFFTSNKKTMNTADAVIFFNKYPSQFDKKAPNQIWALFALESPFHTSIPEIPNKINWTATYRRDSVLVAPYEKFVFFNNFTKLPAKPLKNYAEGKSKLAAWFVSNCHTPNGRAEYVKELQKYIDVDIYGYCGTMKCPKSNSKDCQKMLSKKYKFYLAFENSNCKDYITEKFFVNGLGNDVLPVAMGARPEDYKALAPPHSYLHVDNFTSPKHLAEYLHKLDKDDDLYNSYFLWKGSGEFINTKFWCRLCSMVHGVDDNTGHPGNSADPGKRMLYKNVRNWWKGGNVCIGKKGIKGYASWKGVQYNDNFLLDQVELYE